ncbi:MAG: hypothetical protein QE271_12890, partial [Bacteriovoracaceae bacterium]|nr:hypothetical protein [Bacteriovoracaceae bacterium]
MKNILTQSKNFLGMNIYSITFASLLSLSALAQAPDSKDEKNAAGSMSTADEAKSLMNSTSTNKTYSDVDLKQY